MATSQSQVGVKKRRKAQRPLIVPALPLNLKSRPTPASEPTSIRSSDVNFASAPEPGNVSEQIKEACLSTQALGESSTTGTSPETVLKNGNAHQSALPKQDARLARHASSAAPEVVERYAAPFEGGVVDTSRSVTPKASSRAAPSSTQSPAPESAQQDVQVNGITAQAFQVLSLNTGGTANNHPGLQSQALTQLSLTTPPNSMAKPQRYSSNEEPILDWADEMSEEMPPDTLHIPSVPHLPELSSDSNAAHKASSQAVIDAPAFAYATKPVFGFAAVPELQSDIEADDTLGNEAPILTNGHSYTSQPRLASGGIIPSKPDRNMIPLTNGHVRQISQAVAQQPLPSMSSHLNKLFDTREWADWTIQLISLNASYPPIAYHAHGAVISRNQILCSHMRRRLQTRAMPTVISLSPPRYVQPAAFEAALKYLYDEKPLTPAEAAGYFSFGMSVTESNMKIYRLDFCVSYWLSGCLLGVSPIIEAGLELLYEYIDWDTAELLIKAALDMKDFSSTRSLSKLANGAANTPSTPDLATSPLSAKTRDTGTEQMGTTQEAHSLQIIGLLTDALANGRLRVGLQEFRMYTSPPDILRSRLPDVQKHDKPHSALSSIMFGSLPTTSPSASSNQIRPSQPVFSFSSTVNTEYDFSAAEKALSAILLNVSFTELNELFNGFMRIFAVEDVLDLFERFVSERESRRIAVASSDWYQSEVVAKRRLSEVDQGEKVVRDGEQSHLKRTGHANSDWDYDDSQ